MSEFVRYVVVLRTCAAHRVCVSEQCAFPPMAPPLHRGPHHLLPVLPGPLSTEVHKQANTDTVKHQEQNVSNIRVLIAWFWLVLIKLCIIISSES